jgi:hypothetical protein
VERISDEDRAQAPERRLPNMRLRHLRRGCVQRRRPFTSSAQVLYSALVPTPERTQGAEVKVTHCGWTEEDDYWHTGCGEAFTFTEGGPKENNFKYCYSCGKKIDAEYLSREPK